MGLKYSLGDNTDKDPKRVMEIIQERINMAYITDLIKKPVPLDQMKKTNEKKQVNIFALGDVGSTLLSGLFLLGAERIHTIGIWDLDPRQVDRFETEYGQIAGLSPRHVFPEVVGLERDRFFNGDVAVFCASAGVPPLSHTKGDVRMMQWERNRALVEEWVKEGIEAGFSGLLAIVSDPVDLLCKAALSTARSIDPLWPADRIRGYGLGVMHGRGCYYSRKFGKYASYEHEGRAFGPHGKGLVLANSIERYDDELSVDLTQQVVEANLVAREKGYKPYIAPALASGALSILSTLSGGWHYSAIYVGDGEKEAYLGQKNRLTEIGTEAEMINLPESLYSRIQKSFDELCRFNERGG